MKTLKLTTFLALALPLVSCAMNAEDMDTTAAAILPPETQMVYTPSVLQPSFEIANLRYGSTEESVIGKNTDLRNNGVAKGTIPYIAFESDHRIVKVEGYISDIDGYQYEIRAFGDALKKSGNTYWFNAEFPLAEYGIYGLNITAKDARLEKSFPVSSEISVEKQKIVISNIRYGGSKESVVNTDPNKWSKTAPSSPVIWFAFETNVDVSTARMAMSIQNPSVYKSSKTYNVSKEGNTYYFSTAYWGAPPRAGIWSVEIQATDPEAIESDTMKFNMEVK